MNSHTTNNNSQSSDGVKSTDLLGPTLVNPWVGQGGFRTRFHTVDQSRSLTDGHGLWCHFLGYHALPPACAHQVSPWVSSWSPQCRFDSILTLYYTCSVFYGCDHIIWLFSLVVTTDSSYVCHTGGPSPCPEDACRTRSRCSSQESSKSHSALVLHPLAQHSTHDTNHVHRVQPLPFTLLPMLHPLSVSSTCYPSLETGSLRWIRMVGHACTGQLMVVAFQWWGTSWINVDLTSAREMWWVVEWYMTLYVYIILCMCAWFIDKACCSLGC